MKNFWKELWKVSEQCMEGDRYSELWVPERRN